MGELAIVRAREKAEKTLGMKFNVRAFHDAFARVLFGTAARCHGAGRYFCGLAYSL
jgi:hypothetical protein